MANKSPRLAECEVVEISPIRAPCMHANPTQPHSHPTPVSAAFHHSRARAREQRRGSRRRVGLTGLPAQIVLNGLTRRLAVATVPEVTSFDTVSEGKWGD